MSVKTGTLFLVPAPLDFGCDTQAPLQDALPSATLQTAARLTHWVCLPPEGEGEGAKRLRGCFIMAAPAPPRAACGMCGSAAGR